MKTKGLTLLEVLITIVIVSLLAIAVSVPYITASSGTGPNGAIRMATASALLQKEAEIISANIAGIPDNLWAETIKSLPVVGSPNIALNGSTYSFRQSYECITSNLANDTSCLSGFVRITVVVTQLDAGSSFDLSFLKTRNGI